ncbi:MAG: hypothetical protein H0U57_04000 [Tatlockia sp.]|nr:hypothetical protein [Tatlockia sp.]
MKFYEGRHANFERDFNRIKISSSAETKEWIREILNNLNIPRTDWNKFSPRLTIYEFLLQLARDGHPQINYIIEVIDEKQRLSTLELVLGGGIIFSFIAYLLTQPTLQFIINTTVSFFSSIVSFPILGLVYNLGLYMYYFFDYYKDRKKTNFNRFRDYTFLTLSSAATVAAYIVLITTAATMSPVIAGLYVTSAAIDFLREVFCLAQEFFQYVYSPPINENDYLSVHRDYARRVFGFEKRRNALAISFVAGLVVVGITALWCFLPGGMAATIFALSAIGIVYLLKIVLVKRNEQVLREHLQEQLNILETTYGDIELDPSQSPSPNLSIQDEPELTPRHPHDPINSSQNIHSPRVKSVSTFSARHRPFFASLEDQNLMHDDLDSSEWEFSEEESYSFF